jgi:hypothetical protein
MSGVSKVTGGLTALVVVLSLVLLGGLCVVYYGVGWHRMESACQPNRHGGVELDWDWSAPGFRCTWRDGHEETELWW